MTFSLVNVIMAVVFIAAVIASIAVHRHLVRKVRDADGFDGVNVYGEPGCSDEGDPVIDIDEEQRNV